MRRRLFSNQVIISRENGSDLMLGGERGQINRNIAQYPKSDQGNGSSFVLINYVVTNPWRGKPKI